MENWLKDLETIEKRYCSAVEGTEEYTLDEHIAFLEELKSDDCDDNDEEFDESICCGLDLQTKEEYEARMVEIIRRFRQNYETNCRLMRESSNLACDAVETENEPNKSLDIIESMNEVYVENENEKSITLSDWYISLTSQLSVVLIGKREDSENVWQTTAIKDRVNESPTKLRTFSDSLYILEGEIDQRSMQQNYFPDSIIKHFCHGFPENWQTIIQTYGLQFGFGDKGLPKEHVYFKGKEEYSTLFESSKTGKRKLEEFSDFQLLKSHFPASKFSLPNKRARIETVSEILEVIGGSRGFSCKLLTDSIESDHSCERNENDARHVKRTLKKELLERTRMQQREDYGNFLVESPQSFSRKEDSKEHEAYKHDADRALRNRRCWRERASGGRKDVEAEDLIKNTAIDDSTDGENATGYILRNRDASCANIQLIQSKTPKSEKINKQCFSTIRVRRKRRVPRICKGKTRKRGYLSLDSESHGLLTDLEKGDSFKVLETYHSCESEDAAKPYDCGRVKANVVVGRLRTSSDAENCIETDTRRPSSRYNIKEGDYLKINNSALLGNEDLSRTFRNGSEDKSFAVERSKTSFRYERGDKQDIKGRSCRNERNQQAVKILRPKIKFSDDWDKDIHFGSDDDTDVDTHVPHLSRVYPLRSRIQSGAVSSSETENAKCILNSSCRNDEGIDDHQHVNESECSETVECKGVKKSVENRKGEIQMSKRTVEKTERQGRKEKLEIMEGFGSGDDESWNEQEIEKLQFAMCSFRPETQHFWQKISCFMGTKSPAACQRKYEQLVYPADKKKKGRHNKKLGQMPKENSAKRQFGYENMNFTDVVTAKRGTLRRKQQLRNLLDAYDHGYEDNIFNSTPFRKRQRTIKLPFDVTDISGLNETAGDDDNEDDISSSSCTESSISSALSSSSNLYKTNILVPACRDPADAYLHKLQKLRKRRTHAQAPSTAQERRNEGDCAGMHNSRKSTNNAFSLGDAHVVVDGSDVDDDDDANDDSDDEYFDEDI